jgi:hypothetical protein
MQINKEKLPKYLAEMQIRGVRIRRLSLSAPTFP